MDKILTSEQLKNTSALCISLALALDLALDLPFFCLFDSETDQRALQFLHICGSDVRSHSSALESNKQNPRDRTLDLPFFCRYKHIPSLKNLSSPAPNESLPYWFQGNFAASFVLKFCLREFLLSAFANRFELRCEPKRLMLLCYKICPC